MVWVRDTRRAKPRLSVSVGGAQLPLGTTNQRRTLAQEVYEMSTEPKQQFVDWDAVEFERVSIDDAIEELSTELIMKRGGFDARLERGIGMIDAMKTTYARIRRAMHLLEYLRDNRANINNGLKLLAALKRHPDMTAIFNVFPDAEVILHPPEKKD